jgi:surface protein
MSNMFTTATSFNQPINSWNTSNVTTMNGMFTNATSFNQPINSWNTSKVTTMNGMFTRATSFNQSINSWNTSNVTDMRSMFRFAFSFNQNISNWDIRNVTNMSRMFSDSTWGTVNYDAALIAWSQLVSPKNSVEWGVGTNKYSSAAAAARNILVNTYGWTITDGGLDA